MYFIKSLLPVKEEGVQSVRVAFCTFNESSDNVNGLGCGSVFAKSKLCGSKFCVNSVLKSGLEDSGKNLIGCGEEGDGPIHFWVCGAALAFVDFNYCGLLPGFGQLTCGEDGVKKM